MYKNSEIKRSVFRKISSMRNIRGSPEQYLELIVLWKQIACEFNKKKLLNMSMEVDESVMEAKSFFPLVTEKNE